MPDYNAIQQLNQQVQQTAPQTNVNNLYPTLSSSQLDFQGRYPVYHLGLDNEDIYAQQQGGVEQLKNGLLKGLAITGTTAVAGTVGLINGVYNWAKDGKFSSFYDNPMTQKIDQISQNLENQLPNYESKEQKDRAWYNPRTYITANFWGDNILKNAGFAAGSIISGLAWGKVGSMLGSLSKAAASGVLGEVGANSAIESSLLARDAGSIEQLGSSASIAAQRQLTFDKIKDFGTNIVRAGFSTVGEASMEALQAKNQYKDFLTKEYQDKFGTAPFGTELEKINGEADKVGNFTMEANVALLTATNYIQFPKMVGRLWSGDKLAARAGIGALQLVDEAGQVVERGTANAFKQGVRYQAVEGSKGLLGAVKTVGKVANSLFAGSEAFEEGAQYVIPIAAQDYFNKGRTGQANTVTDSLGEGLKSLWNDKQGMLAIISGGISGGLMEAGNPFHRDAFLGGIRNKGLDRVRTDNFARSLDGVMAGSGYMDQAIASINRDQSLNTDAEIALRNNNRLQYEDTRTDINLNYMIPRIQYGRHDMIQDDLMGLANVASTQSGYAELIKNGVVSDTVSREDFLTNIDRLSNLADNLNTNYKYLNSKYSTITQKDENGQVTRKYSDDVLGKMAYVAAKIDDYNTRIPQLLGIFNASQVNVADLMEEVHTNGVGELTTSKFNEILDQIDAIPGISPEIKDTMRTNVADLVELSARREFKIREYEQMKNNPQDWEEAAKQFSVAEPGQPDMSKVNFNEAEQEEQPGDYKAIYDLVYKQANGETPLEKELELREKYPKLYEQLTGTVEASRFQAQRDQAQREGWYQDSNGNPVPPTSKSTFYDANQGDYTMSVNGIDRDGTLGYDPDTNGLFFQYDDNGVIKQVEVFNEDFNDGTINRPQPTVDTGYLTEEDTSAPNRVQVRIRNFSAEVANRQTQIQSQIDSQLRELNDIAEEIKVQEKDAKEFTKDYVETMSTLRDMQRDVENSYTQLIQERQELANVSAELDSLLQNTPLTLKSSIDLMDRQKADLESLAAHNGLLIPQLTDLANSAREMMTRLGKKLISRIASMAGIPPSPNFNRVRDTFNRWESTGTTEDLRNAVTALQQEYNSIQNFEVRPLSETDVKWLNDKLTEAQNQVKEIDARVKAKQIVSDRLKSLTDQVNEREEIVKTTPTESVADVKEALPAEAKTQAELSDLDKSKENYKTSRVKELEYEGKTEQEAQEQAETEWVDSTEGKRREELVSIVNAPETFGEDSDRTPISRYFNATSLLPQAMRNKAYDKRMNIFLNKIGVFDKQRRPNLRLVAVTRGNEESLGLKGFVDKYFQVRDSFDKSSSIVVGNNPVDAPIGMVIAEIVDGNIVFIDETGSRIETTGDILDKVLVTKMKAASLTWSTGETAYSDPTNLGESVANAKREEFEQQRKSILENSHPQFFTFRTSQGRQRESSATESPNIVGTLITDEVMKQKSPVLEVIRPDQGKSSKVVPGIMEGETVQVKSGTILLRTPDTLQKVYTRPLTQDERNKVKSALMYLVENRESPNETLYKVRAYLEGSTFLKFGSNLETLTIGASKFNLTKDNVSGKSFQQLTATTGLENILGRQNTNVREGLIKSNKAFSEFIGIEKGAPQFKDWDTYQEFILSNEGGRTPLVYAPIMVDKYLLFSPEKKADEVIVKPATSPEVTADRQVKTSNQVKSPDLIKGQTDLIKTVTDYFTRANEEGLTTEQKVTEKNKANATAAIILRTASVMVNRGIYQSVSDVYSALNFSNLYSKLNKGALNETSQKATISVSNVEDYDESSKNTYKPNEQLRFGQGTDYEAVVLVGDPDLLELSSLSSKDRKARGAKNPVLLTESQHNRMRELERKLGIPGFEVNDRLKEIAKENRSTTVEKIVKVDLGSQTVNKSENLRPGQSYKDQNGVSRVWGEDEDADKAYQLSSKYKIQVSPEYLAGAKTAASQINQGNDVVFKSKEAIKIAGDNTLFNTESTGDGTIVIGVIDPQTMEWVGIPKESANDGISVETAPESMRPSLSMIEEATGISNSISQPDVSELLREVANFYGNNALTQQEKETLQTEANDSLGREATPEEVNKFLADGFNQYLREEKANPNQTVEVKGQGSKLREIFKSIRQFLVEIYDSIVDNAIDIKLSLPMKQLYQDMLGIGFAERETKRKNLNKDAFPKSLVGESFATTLDTKDFIKGRNYQILGANSGSVVSVTVKIGETSIDVPKGQVAVKDSITKEIKIVDIPNVLSQLTDSESNKVVKKEREARGVPDVKENIDSPTPVELVTPETKPIVKESVKTPTKVTKLKAPTATVDGLKTSAGPEDTDGGIFLKDGEPVYILPYFEGFVQVDQDTYKAYNKASSPSRGRTEITNSRKLGKVKLGSTVTMSQNLNGVEQEVTYEVTGRTASSITVKNNVDDQIFEVENVSMKTGQEATRETQIKSAFLNKYVGETFKDINTFLNPNPTTIQDISLPDLNIKC